MLQIDSTGLRKAGPELGQLPHTFLIDCRVCPTGVGSRMDILRHGDESLDIEGVKDAACQLVAHLEDYIGAI